MSARTHTRTRTRDTMATGAAVDPHPFANTVGGDEVTADEAQRLIREMNPEHGVALTDVWRGTIYPRPPTEAGVTNRSVEIAREKLAALVRSGAFEGRSVCIEHDRQRAVGRIVRATQRDDGTVDIEYRLRKDVANSNELFDKVARGELNELSLSHIYLDNADEVVPLEVSLVRRAARGPECRVVCASFKFAAPPPAAAAPPTAAAAPPTAAAAPPTAAAAPPTAAAAPPAAAATVAPPTEAPAPMAVEPPAVPPAATVPDGATTTTTTAAAAVPLVVVKEYSRTDGTPVREHVRAPPAHGADMTSVADTAAARFAARFYEFTRVRGAYVRSAGWHAITRPCAQTQWMPPRTRSDTLQRATRPLHRRR